MANLYEETDIQPEKFVTLTSRYSRSTVAYYSERRLLTFSIYKRTERVPGQNDKYMVITKGTEYRPDLLSKKAYGVVDFWWQIMEANHIADIYDFKAGLNIVIPDVILQ